MTNVERVKLKIRTLAWRFLWRTERWLPLREISRAVDDNRYADARRLLGAAYKVWGEDPELIRLSSFMGFMEDSEEFCVCGHLREHHDSSAHQLGCQAEPEVGSSACPCHKFNNGSTEIEK